MESAVGAIVFHAGFASTNPDTRVFCPKSAEVAERKGNDVFTLAKERRKEQKSEPRESGSVGTVGLEGMSAEGHGEDYHGWAVVVKVSCWISIEKAVENGWKTG